MRKSYGRWLFAGIFTLFFICIQGCAPVTPRPARSLSPGETYLVYHQAVDSEDLDKARVHLSSLKSGELEGRSDDDVLAELRVLHPVAGLTVTAESVENGRAAVTVQGTAMEMNAVGTIQMVHEDGGWKLLGEQWNLESGESEPAESLPDATLHEAARAGDTAAVKSLIAAGTDVNSLDDVTRTPLIWAANYGHTDAMAALIAAGADLDVKNDSGETALMVAASAGEPGAVEMLVKAGADVHIVDSTGRGALLHVAMVSDWVIEQMDNGERDAVGMLQALIGAGEDINETDEWQKRTALMETALAGRTGMVKLLLERKAEVNRVSVEGSTAVMDAAKAGHQSIVKMLIEKGADLSLKDITGRTVLDWAADYPAIAQMLKDHGATGKAPRKQRQAEAPLPEYSPEQQQAAKDRLRAMRYSEFNGSMMLNAAAQGDLEAVKLFLQAGVPIDSKDEYDHVSTALNRAVDHGGPELALFLIRSGADVEAGIVAPLINAAGKCDFTDVVRELIRAGADVNVKAPGGATPLMMAKIMNCSENARVLSDAGAEE